MTKAQLVDNSGCRVDRRFCLVDHVIDLLRRCNPKMTLFTFEQNLTSDFHRFSLVYLFDGGVKVATLVSGGDPGLVDIMLKIFYGEDQHMIVSYLPILCIPIV